MRKRASLIRATQQRTARLDRIRESIAAGIAEADRGEAKPLDVEGVVDEIMARRKKEAVESTLIRNSSKTVVERAKRDHAYAAALLAEAMKQLAPGDARSARLILRDVVDATVGFEKLSRLTGTPAKSLHRMLSTDGNPSMDDLAKIMAKLRLGTGSPALDRPI